MGFAWILLSSIAAMASTAERHTVVYGFTASHTVVYILFNVFRRLYIKMLLLLCYLMFYLMFFRRLFIKMLVSC